MNLHQYFNHPSAYKVMPDNCGTFMFYTENYLFLFTIKPVDLETVPNEQLQKILNDNLRVARLSVKILDRYTELCLGEESNEFVSYLPEDKSCGGYKRKLFSSAIFQARKRINEMRLQFEKIKAV
ncbi:hypothetical protein [Rodentibacter myodis]|uniref:Uncharacterized protein n=1 Tax=Rodentibacter myodis TaxID=1907939 RepID=A0A1V3JSD6_9PAST|nr:hypothetical protein [Rodentibacter myodis]OOF59710.1 hypothetical protein BKL49_02670 [Rodentibacter myodis]